MKTKRCFFIFLFVVVVWPLATFSAGVGDESPSFFIKTMDNKEFRSEEIKGEQPMLLIFWATWCPVCKEEIPKLNEIYATFEPKGMAFLAVNVGVNDSEKRVTRYSKKYKISYPVAFDEGSRVTKLFNVRGTPTIIITDKSGVVRYRSSEVPEDLVEHFESLSK